MGKTIPFVPVAERVAVEALSTTELVFARKPVAFTDATLTEMSAMVGAGKVTVSTAMAATDVSTAMMASCMASAMMASCMASAMATMTTATVTTTLAPRSVGRQSQCPERNSHCQNPRQLGFHSVLPVNALSETSIRKRSNRNIVARIRPPIATVSRGVCLGQKQTFHQVRAMSALPPKADIDQHGRDVR